MNQLWDPSQPDVTCNKALVKFPAFEHYKQQAQQIARYINSIVLTDDNVKDVKKDLAAARKVTDGLDKKRIRIKNAILEEYVGFESQVKELQGIIKEAESTLRTKVREMEEEERQAKKVQIREIWDKRYPLYEISQYLTPDDAFRSWLTPQHLNKSTSIKSIEKEMVEWLEATDKDVSTVKSMGDDYLIEYIGCLNLPDAISAVNLRNEIKMEIEQGEYEEITSETTATFIITGEKNIKLTELLLKDNDIEYRKR